MFSPQPSNRKDDKVIIRVSFTKALMDRVREKAEQVDADPTDIIRQAVEYALSPEQTEKKSPKKRAKID